MKKVLIPLAIAAATLSLSAQAQDAGRFAVTAGFAGQQLGGDTIGGQVPLADYPVGSHLERDDDSNAAALGASFFVTPQFAIELWGAGKFDARTEIDVPRTPDVSVLRYETRPIALSAQYHFTQLGDRFKPLVGLGINRTTVSGITANRDIPGVAGLKIDNGTGLVATAGLDVALTERLFARGDVRYLRWKSDVGTAGSTLRQEADMHAVVYGVSLGMRF